MACFGLSEKKFTRWKWCSLWFNEILFLRSRLNDNHPFHQWFFSSTESAVGFFKSFRSSNLEYVYHHTNKANDSVCNWPSVQILHQSDRIKVLKKEIWWDKILVGTGIWTRALPTRVVLSEHCFHYSDLHLPDWSTNLLLTYSLWPLGEQAKVTKTATVVTSNILIAQEQEVLS